MLLVRNQKQGHPLPCQRAGPPHPNAINGQTLLCHASERKTCKGLHLMLGAPRRSAVLWMFDWFPFSDSKLQLYEICFGWNLPRSSVVSLDCRWHHVGKSLLHHNVRGTAGTLVQIPRCLPSSLFPSLFLPDFLPLRMKMHCNISVTTECNWGWGCHTVLCQQK